MTDQIICQSNIIMCICTSLADNERTNKIYHMFKRTITSPILMIALLMIYCISMAVATFVEKEFGSHAARVHIYHNIWFILLQLLISINGIAIIRRRGLFSLKSIGSLLFHLSFVVILLGAMTTHLLGKEGTMHIREGRSVDFINLADGNKELLPIEVHLNDFILTRYSGSNSPSAYESHITIHHNGEVSKHIVGMNQVVNIDGYRLFQSSYDKDENGTILTINYDFPGMQITYFGYLLLMIAILITPLQRSSRLRRLNRRFKALGSLIILCSISCSSAFGASTPTPTTVANQQAKEFGALLIQNPKGRVEPVNSWTSKILRKIHNSTSYGEYTSDQVFLNLFIFAEQWSNQPLIRVKNPDIQRLLNTSDEYVSYNQLFTEHGNGSRRYLIRDQVEQSYSISPAKRSKLDKDILSLDEVVNIILQIQAGRLMAIFPHPTQPNGNWLSPGDDLTSLQGADSMFISKVMTLYAIDIYKGAKDGEYNNAAQIVEAIESYQLKRAHGAEAAQQRVNAELTYNRLNIFGNSFKAYLALGLILMCICFDHLLKSRWRAKRLKYLAIFSIFAIFTLHTYGIALRWYISGHGPWTNAYETMVFVSWSVALIGLAFTKRSTIITALCSILAGVLLFVSSLNWVNPEITPLIPVLQSYWLMLHVAIIMMGYGFLFVSALIGLFNLATFGFVTQKNRTTLLHSINKLTIINEISMILGTIFMCVGIFLGAVWANESWGRYWGWDPKETWALITMIAYTAILHMRFIPQLDNPWIFNIKSVWAILTVLMTYFGVNYYLSGLHSYSNSDGELLTLPLIVGLILLAIISAWSCRGRKHTS